MGKFLQSVTKTTGKLPHSIIIYGPDGVGKTTFASEFEKPIFIGTENGAGRLSLDVFPTPKSFQEVLAQIKELHDETHAYKTLVVDSLDWLEAMIWTDICETDGVKNIEQAFGGFAKGYTEALKYWQKFRPYLEKLRLEKGMNIVLIAHSYVKPFNDPFTNSTYDRYQIKLHDKAAAYLREAVDCVLFGTFKVATQGKENQKHKAYGDGSRVLYTERRPGFDAKNRLGLPFMLPLSYEDFAKACDQSSPQKIQETIDRIQVILEFKNDSDLTQKVHFKMEEAKDSLTHLLAIENRLQTLILNEENLK